MRWLPGRPVSGEEARVDTPFRFNDGDNLVIRLRRLRDGGFEWTDLGHTFMHLSYSMDVDALLQGPRAVTLTDALRRLDVEDRDGELVLAASEAALGSSLLLFAQALVQVADLRYTTRELVQSTFLDDFRGLMKDSFGGRATLDYTDPDHDPNAEYTIDCLINGVPRPVAVFAIPNDTACLLATITLLQMRGWGRRMFTVGVHEDHEERNRRALARFTDVVDKQFSALAGSQDAVTGYLSERIAEQT